MKSYFIYLLLIQFYSLMSVPKTYHNPINGEFTTILQSSEDTHGAYTQMEVSLNAGGKNPMHFHHHFTEEFEAVEGTLYLIAGKEKTQLLPGETLTVEALIRHQFYNPSNKTIVFRVKLFPGQPGFENFIKTTFGLVNDGKTWKNQVPKNLLHAAVLLHWGDTHLTNYFFRKGEPLLRKMYQKAVKKGIEAELKSKYC